MKKFLIVISAVCCCIFSAAYSQTQTRGNLDTATTNFVQKAAKGGMMEVVSGKLAASKGKSTAVRNFGSRMVLDHSKANAKLKLLAKAKGVDLPPLPSPDPMLTQASGADFDRQYVTMMVKDHEEDVAEFQKAAAGLPDPQVRAFAASTLPVLKAHLESIRQIARQMKINK